MIDNNYWFFIFCYIFIDGSNIMPTAFEFLALAFNMTLLSHPYATKKIIQEHIKESIDPLIVKVQLEIAKGYQKDSSNENKSPSPSRSISGKSLKSLLD